MKKCHVISSKCVHSSGYWLLYPIILAIGALHNNLQSHRHINVSAAHKNAVCLFCTNLGIFRGHQMCPSGQSALPGCLSYLPVTLHLKIKSNYVGFITIV